MSSSQLMNSCFSEGFSRLPPPTSQALPPAQARIEEEPQEPKDSEDKKPAAALGGSRVQSGVENAGKMLVTCSLKKTCHLGNQKRCGPVFAGTYLQDNTHILEVEQNHGCQHFSVQQSMKFSNPIPLNTKTHHLLWSGACEVSLLNHGFKLQTGCLGIFFSVDVLGLALQFHQFLEPGPSGNDCDIANWKPWPSRNSGYTNFGHGDFPVRYVTNYQRVLVAPIK